jgi:hypothetical protein
MVPILGQIWVVSFGCLLDTMDSSTCRFSIGLDHNGTYVVRTVLNSNRSNASFCYCKDKCFATVYRPRYVKTLA